MTYEWCPATDSTNHIVLKYDYDNFSMSSQIMNLCHFDHQQK